MRHGKKTNHLSRTASHRRAMLANMACSLIEHKRINTTVAKAKALKKFVEPLITKSRASSNPTTEKGVHNRRVVFSYLRSKEAVTELFGPVADKVGERAGGYTRIIKLGNRLGDNADMAMIELVDFNELYTAGEKKAKSTRRSRRGKGKSSDEEEKPVAAAEAVVTETAEESDTSEVAEEEVVDAAGEADVQEEQSLETEEEPQEEAPETDDSQEEQEDDPKS